MEKRHTKIGRIERHKRLPFYGDVVTPANRRAYMKAYRMDYLIHNKDHEDRDLIEKEAEWYPKYVVEKEKRHLKAYIKGKQFYKYKGKTYFVLSNAPDEIDINN